MGPQVYNSYVGTTIMSANMNISVNGAHNSVRNGLPCKYIVIITTEYVVYNSIKVYCPEYQCVHVY